MTRRLVSIVALALGGCVAGCQDAQRFDQAERIVDRLIGEQASVNATLEAGQPIAVGIFNGVLILPGVHVTANVQGSGAGTYTGTHTGDAE